MRQTTSELLKEYAQNPSIELRNKIVEENLYIVDILIRKYLGKGVDYDDLSTANEGNLRKGAGGQRKTHRRFGTDSDSRGNFRSDRFYT